MPELDTSRLNLLLLEDDPDDQLLFREMVEDLGAQAPSLQITSTAEEAELALRSPTPDLCFVDYRLGADSGLDFIRKQSARHPNLPFVLLTGQGGPEVDEQALQAGARLYLQKGKFSEEELLRCIRYTVAQTWDLTQVHDQRRLVNELLESLGEVLWIFDVKAEEFLEMGPGIEKISGRPAEKIKKDPSLWTSLVVDGQGPMSKKLLESTETGTANAFEYMIQDLEDVPHLIREHTYRVETSIGQDLLVGILRDVTEEMASKSELVLMKEVIQQVEDAVLVTDKHLDQPGGPHILYANPSFLKMTGYSLEEVLGRSPSFLQGPETNQLVLQSLNEELKAGNKFSAETVNYRKDGSSYVVRWSITPVLNEEGVIQYYASLQRDVTEEIETRERKMRAQRLESLGNMVGGIAHDLNNILSPILMGAEMMEEADSAEMRSSLTKSMVESAERAAALVNKLLTFARGGSSEKRYLAPESVLDEILKIIEETFPREIEVKLKVDENLWTTRCSSSEIQQVMLNLAINAKDSMKGMDSGSLHLSAENCRMSSLQAEKLGLAGGGPYVCLSVKDSGTGMTPDVLDHIFDPFFTTKEEGEGTGLGLPSSLGIVQEHEGTIEVQSQPWNGTCFQVYLPAFPDQRPDDLAYGIQKFEYGEGQQILVVDDEPSITNLVCELLEEYGYRAKGLTSSIEALKYLTDHTEEFDALLTDMMMPELDGLGLIRGIRDIRPELPVIIMTGYVHHDKLEESMQEGLDHILTKPVRTESLMKLLNDLFRTSN